MFGYNFNATVLLSNNSTKHSNMKLPWLVVCDFNQSTVITLHILIILTDGALIIINHIHVHLATHML